MISEVQCWQIQPCSWRNFVNQHVEFIALQYGPCSTALEIIHVVPTWCQDIVKLAADCVLQHGVMDWNALVTRMITACQQERFTKLTQVHLATGDLVVISDVDFFRWLRPLHLTVLFLIVANSYLCFAMSKLIRLPAASQWELSYAAVAHLRELKFRLNLFKFLKRIKIVPGDQRPEIDDRRRTNHKWEIKVYALSWPIL